ncbi:hypothetical protein TVAG_022220 [Trichomonas vaginalis G3]|uniref:Uncharacterized protein n=1 Tax=Trichomonas vaginalis (strain ATCC PRA-98 / G3) TaxID=412133 RepID=A2FFU0_TRIV3|nr:hypothetical protein TVAGG3_0558080 [Trichomonas vaginalis G3]EAX96239.1 hypothetical protein TVAG_022220 [Trichomonas vaginalis G3]KAI5520992.1 hypothetical protein TVAGG3_0558080 [Trichomonas vaginalis G3]|eukprot:XP_001309169.1 hypothetical protein [Trichomonas vaginalis G3]
MSDSDDDFGMEGKKSRHEMKGRMQRSYMMYSSLEPEDLGAFVFPQSSMHGMSHMDRMDLGNHSSMHDAYAPMSRGIMGGLGLGGGYYGRSEKRSHKGHGKYADCDDFEDGAASFLPKSQSAPNSYVKKTSVEELIPFSPIIF